MRAERNHQLPLPRIKAREWASRSKFQFAPAWRIGLFKRSYLLTLCLLRRML